MMMPHELRELLEASDEVLVVILREGSESQAEAAAQILFDKYYTKLFRFVYHRGIPIEDTEDIVQETLERGLFEKLAQFKPQGEGSFRRWLYTIAKHLVADYHKNLINRIFVSLDKLVEQGRRFPAPEHATVKEMEVRELLEGAGLGATECEVVVLTYTHNMKPRDIEAELGIPAEEVSRILYRAKQKLKRRLRQP
jgi:RNA polymerase sigma-70 factor (ECF subfamily)